MDLMTVGALGESLSTPTCPTVRGQIGGWPQMGERHRPLKAYHFRGGHQAHLTSCKTCVKDKTGCKRGKLSRLPVSPKNTWSTKWDTRITWHNEPLLDA